MGEQLYSKLPQPDEHPSRLGTFVTNNIVEYYRWIPTVMR